MSPLFDPTLISTKEASEKSGYNQDYLSRLCKSGKINATQFGRVWLINESSLMLFVRSQEKQKADAARKLSKDRELEYQRIQQSKLSTAEVARPKNVVTPSAFKAVLLRPRMAIAVALMVVAGSAYASVPNAIPSVASSASNSAVAFARVHAFSYHPDPSSTYAVTPVPSTPLARATDSPSNAANPQKIAARFAYVSGVRTNPYVNYESGNDSFRATVVAVPSLSLASGSFAANSIINAYVRTGEVALTAINSILDEYDAVVETSGAATYDSTSKLAAYSSDITDGYAAVINGWIEGSSYASVAVANAEISLGTLIERKGIDASIVALASAPSRMASRDQYSASAFDAIGNGIASTWDALGTTLYGGLSTIAEIFTPNGDTVAIRKGTPAANVQNVTFPAPVPVPAAVSSMNASSSGVAESYHSIPIAVPATTTYVSYVTNTYYPTAPASAGTGFGTETGAVSQEEFQNGLANIRDFVRQSVDAVAGSVGRSSTNESNSNSGASAPSNTGNATFNNATITNANITNLVTSNVNLGGSIFTSLLGTGLQNVGGVLSVATSTLGFGNGTGSVTSVNASGGSTGLAFTGGPVTASGTLTLAGTLGVANGGSGATTLTGLLKGNGTSAFSAAVAGTDYQAPITLTTTGTSGAATFAGNTLNIPQYAGTTYTAGTGLSLTGTTFANTGVLSFNGRTGAVAPGSSDYTTTQVAEGSNLYFTNARADARVQAATTLPNLTSATSLGTVATTLTGILRATAGVLSTSTINLGSSDVTGTLPTTNGGIGLTTAPTLNQILLGNGSGGYSLVSTSSLGFSTTTGTVTSVQASGGTTGFTFTGGPVTTSGTLTLAGTLGVANGGSGATTLTGLLKGNGTSAFSAAVAGTDYQAPLSFAYPLINTGNIISTAFSTSTVNTYSALQTFNGGASSTALSVTGATKLNTLSLGSLSGFLKATAGTVATSLIDLSADVTSTLPTTNGGTGQNTYATGDLLYGNSTGSLSVLPVGAAGKVLKVIGGVPSWSDDLVGSGGGGSDGIFATSTGLIYPLNPSSALIIGDTSAASPSSVFETHGSAYISGNLGVATTTPSARLAITGAGTTTGRGLVVTNSANLPNFTVQDNGNVSIRGSLTLDSLSGLLRANAGLISTSTINLGSSDVTGTLPTTNGGIGLTTAPTLNQILLGNGSGGYSLVSTSSLGFSTTTGTVTSVQASGGTTGFTFTGGPVTTSGTLTLAGTLGVANGGSGATTLTGLLKGNGTSAFSAAVAGTDYQAPITLTTTGTSGAATFAGNTLNIPQYAGTTYTAGTGLTLSGGNAFSVNTSQNISTLSNLTTNGLVKTSGGTGALSVAVAGTDYQAPGNYITGLTGDGTATGPGSAAFTLATVNGNTGTFNNVTVNGKGLVTAASNVAYLTNAITGIGPAGQLQTGPSVTLGTTTSTTNGITSTLAITGSGNVITFAPSTNGTLMVAGGGSGATSLTGLLKGNGTSAFSAAVAGTDYLAPASLSAGTGISYNSGTGVIANTGVLSFNGRTGAVAPGSSDYTTTQVAEGSNLYFTNARADARVQAATTLPNLTSATSLGTVATTLTGILRATAGVLSTSTINLGSSDVTGTLPTTNGGIGLTTAPTLNQILLGNGSGGYSLVSTSSLGFSTTTGTVTSVQASGGTTGFTFTGGPVTTSGTLTLAGTLGVANGGSGATTLTGLLKGNGTSAFSAAVAGTDYQAPITLTTTGTSGAATFAGNTLNIPQYAGTTYTAGTGLTLSGGNAFSVNTSQNISTLSNLTTNGLVKTSGGTGALSVAVAGTDYQAPGNYITGLTGDGTATGPGSAAFTLATVNGNTGTFNNVTVNGKGLVTAASNVAYLTNAITGIGPAGQIQNGPTITQATTSAAFNGLTPSLTITGSGNTLTYASTLSGNLAVAGGGTGATSLTGLLKGNGTSAFSAAVAGTDYQAPITLTTTGTSGAATFAGNTLNIPQYAGTTYTAGTGLSLTGTTFANTGVLSFNGRTGAVAPTTGDYTTALVTEDPANLYFTNARADARVQAATSTPNLLTATSLNTLATSLTGILRATSGVLSTGAANLASSDISGILPIANGGTNANAQTTNGVNYFDGTRITSGTGLTFAGGNLGVGTGASDSLVTISTSTSFAAPRAGTMLHIVGESAINPRVELDYYNSSASTGPIYQGRHARGTAAAPSATLADDILAAFGGDSYGTTGFHTTSPGSLTIRAESNATDTSAPTYLTFSTTPSGSVTGLERLRITSNGYVGIGTTTPNSLFSIGGVASFTTATTTFYSSGGINLTSGCFAVNGTCIGGSAPSSGLTGIGPAGQIQTGPTITQATTTSTTNGLTSALTITGSGNTLTYTPSLSGTLSLAGGGTNNNGASLTTNGVEFYDGSSITNGTGLVFVGGKLGIGSTTPSQALSVVGNGAFTGDLSFANLKAAGTAVITAQDPQAIAIGRQGITNPAFNVDSSNASSATGINLVSNIAGSGVALNAISTAAAEGLNIDAKGSGYVNIGANSGGFTFGNATTAGTSNISLAQGSTLNFKFGGVAYQSFTKSSTAFSDGSSNSGGTGGRFTWSGAADTNLTASTEAPDIYFNNGQIRQHATGALALQRDFRVTGSTESFVGASVLTTAAAFSVDGPSAAGANATITNSSAIYVPTSALSTSVTNAYGLNIAAATGATNNYAAAFTGGSVGVGTTTPTAQLATTGTVRFSNFGAGTLTTDAQGNLSVSSDERLKNINGTYSRGLSDLEKLSPILYHWNTISGLDQTTQYAGFSAQNVQSAIPEAINTDPRGYLTLQDRPILAAAVNAIKELAGTSTSLSTTTNNISDRLALVEQKATAPLVIPQTLSASTISAQTVTLQGLLAAGSAQIVGDVQGARFIAPASVSSGITTNPSVPAEVLTASGDTDIGKMASYTLGFAQSLATQANALSSKIDALDARVASLENVNLSVASSTQTTPGLDIQSAFASLGAMIKDGFAQFTSLAVNQLTIKKTQAGASAAGSANVPAGATSVTVTNSIVSPTSKIFITLTSVSNGTWYVSNKQSGSFTVNWSAPQQGTTFDYFIVGTDGDSTESQPQQPSGAVVAPVQALTPASAPTQAPSTSTTTIPVVNDPVATPASSTAIVPTQAAAGPSTSTPTLAADSSAANKPVTSAPDATTPNAAAAPALAAVNTASLASSTPNP